MKYGVILQVYIELFSASTIQDIKATYRLYPSHNKRRSRDLNFNYILQ